MILEPRLGVVPFKFWFKPKIQSIELPYELWNIRIQLRTNFGRSARVHARDLQSLSKTLLNLRMNYNSQLQIYTANSEAFVVRETENINEIIEKSLEGN